MLRSLHHQTSSLESLDILSINKSDSWTGTSLFGDGRATSGHHEHPLRALDSTQPWANYRAPQDLQNLDKAADVNSTLEPEEATFLLPETEQHKITFWRAEKARMIQPIDLRAFQVLKTVSCHATDLLGPMVRADPTSYRRLADVLPSSLEVLKLHYSEYCDDYEPQWRFACGEYGFDEFEMEQGWYTAYYGHVEQLMRDKAEKLQNLNRFEMQLMREWWPRPWKGIEEAAEKVDVRLVVEWPEREELFIVE